MTSHEVHDSPAIKHNVQEFSAFLSDVEAVVNIDRFPSSEVSIVDDSRIQKAQCIGPIEGALVLASEKITRV